MDLNTLLISQNNPVTLNVKGLVLDGVDQAPANKPYIFASLSNANVFPLALQTPVKWNTAQSNGLSYNPATGAVTFSKAGKYLCAVSLTVNNATAGVVSVQSGFNLSSTNINIINVSQYASSNTTHTNLYLITVAAAGAIMTYDVSPSSSVASSSGTFSCEYFDKV
jgi:hypothetical protein